jgi:ubiquinone/menaquinone biosynthesis C-methylase UbiE
VSVFDKNAERYDRWYDKNKEIFLSEVEALSYFMPSTGIGIEIGVGTGRFAQKLNIAYGIDPSVKMLRKAKKRGVNITEGAGENMPFKDGSFDYALSVVTICFVNDPVKVLKETYRILDDKGIVVIGFIEKESDLGKFYQTKKESIFYNEAKFYTFKEIKSFLEKVGFNYAGARQVLFNGLKSKEREKSRPGYGDGGFVAVKGIK